LGFDFTRRLTRPGEWTRRIAFVSAGVAAGGVYVVAITVWVLGEPSRQLIENVKDCWATPFQPYVPAFLPSWCVVFGALALLWAAEESLRLKAEGDEAAAERRLGWIGAAQGLGLMLIGLDIALHFRELLNDMAQMHSAYCEPNLAGEFLCNSWPAALAGLLLGASWLLLIGRLRRYVLHCGWMVQVGLVAGASAVVDCHMFLAMY